MPRRLSRRCAGCGSQRLIHDYQTRTTRTLFGKIAVRFPRFRRCDCESGRPKSATCCALDYLLPGRTTSEFDNVLAERFCRKLFGNDGEGMKAPLIAGEFVMFQGPSFRPVGDPGFCVRWYLAYNLSLRDLEEMMAERGLKRRSLHSCIAGSSASRRSCWSASTGASVPSQASGTWTRPISRSAVNGCISTGPSTASVTRWSSSSANAVTWWRAKRFLRRAFSAPWPPRADRHRRQPDQSRGHHCLRR